MPLPQADKEETVNLALDDLRRLYDHIANNWSTLKNRVLTVAFGEVAIVSFILSGKGIHPSKLTSAEQIFFYAGASLMAVSFVIMIWIISTSHWIIPMDVPESRKLYKRHSSKLEYLEHIKGDYEDTIDFCINKVATRGKVFNIVLIALTCGIIILLVIKFTR